ncbi:DUF296 domain-containing protein [Candidatus Micrarchaeota archaeon]|nr:DUF296 domain-containing protein [Candidatus Micrarchaeota archaeon]
MNAKQVEGKRMFLVRIDKGEEVLSVLTKFCEEKKIQGGVVWGLGAFGEADFVVGASVDRVTPAMETVKGPIEVGVAHGNISLKEGKPFIHLHCSASLLGDVDKKEKGEKRTINSHVSRAIVSLTGEFVIMETNAFERAFDERIKMFTWKP